MHLPAFLLLEISLLFGGVTWACLKTVTNVPGNVTPPCELCPDNSFYRTDLCDDPEGGCMIIPATDVITPSTGSSGCKQAEMVCPPGSMVVASAGGAVFPPSLWTTFRTELNFTNIVCSDETMWLIVFGETAAPLDYIYCYNRNCSLCSDIRAPTAAECDPATPCLPPMISYNPATAAPGADCRAILIECPAPPAGFPTANVEFFSTGMAPRSFTLEQLQMGQAGVLACGNQAMWTLTPPGEASLVISTIACRYTA